MLRFIEGNPSRLGEVACFIQCIKNKVKQNAEIEEYVSSTLYLHLSFPSGTPIMWILVCLMLSCKSLELSSFFSFFLTFFFFFFSAFIGWVPLPRLWAHWIFLLLHLVCCWTTQVYFFISLIVFFSSMISVWDFLTFSVSLLKFSFCSSFLSEVQWAFLWPLLWTLYQVSYLFQFYWAFFPPEVLPCSFVWNIVLYTQT